MLVENAKEWYKMASNWVMGAAGTALTIYALLDEYQQRALLSHLPVPPWMIPIAITAIGIAARLWKQKWITPPPKGELK